LAGEFNFIVVGGGSAGCVLADRLKFKKAYEGRFVETPFASKWLWPLALPVILPLCTISTLCLAKKQP
jgi:flavin-dependent dehydrogenase